jgi:hypothetical protein
MSRMTPDTQRLHGVVEARLGRPPQDMLEAAVVLEAWGGVPARDALAAGRALMGASAGPQEASVARLQGPGEAQEGFLVEAIAFVMAVVAIACWAVPLASSLGAGLVQRALIVALPVTLGLQWGLRSRYLGRPDGLSHLGRRPYVLSLGVVAAVALPLALMGLAGAVAGLMTLTWTGGTILIRRRWAAGYVGVIIVATAAMLGGMSPPAVLGVTAAITTLGVLAAVRAPTAGSLHPPGRWGRALSAGAIGIGLGVMLVADRNVDWSGGAVTAIALLPSTVASFWGGYHLWQFQQAIPRGLSGVALRDAQARRLAWGPLRILLGAIVRLVSLATVLSAALVAGTAWAGVDTVGIGVLIGFGLIALATLLVSLLESVGRARWALIAVGLAIAAEAAIGLSDWTQFAAPGLMVGGAVAVLVALPAAIALLSRPASTLATSLWIP